MKKNRVKQRMVQSTRRRHVRKASRNELMRELFATKDNPALISSYEELTEYYNKTDALNADVGLEWIGIAAPNKVYITDNYMPQLIDKGLWEGDSEKAISFIESLPLWFTWDARYGIELFYTVSHSDAIKLFKDSQSELAKHKCDLEFLVNDDRLRMVRVNGKEYTDDIPEWREVFEELKK